VVLIDGTPIPTGNRTGTTNFNGKHRKQALNIQVAAHLNGDLAAVSVPVRGSRHDSRALEEVGWAEQIATARAGNELLAVFADTAYVKQWKMLSTGYRGRLTELPSVIHMITNLEFYRQAT
jgi:hypothetical protein